jgi:hypothetical protein
MVGRVVVAVAAMDDTDRPAVLLRYCYYADVVVHADSKHATPAAGYVNAALSFKIPMGYLHTAVRGCE